MPIEKEESSYFRTLYNNILLKLKLNIKKLKMSKNEKKKEKSIYGKLLEQHLKEETNRAFKKAIKNKKQRRKFAKLQDNIKRDRERKSV